MDITSEEARVIELLQCPAKKVRVTAENGHVTGLEIRSAGLASLPENIHLLKYLRFLILPINRLSRLPETLGCLTSLTELDLGYNKLTSLPAGFGNLTGLH